MDQTSSPSSNLITERQDQDNDVAPSPPGKPAIRSPPPPPPPTSATDSSSSPSQSSSLSPSSSSSSPPSKIEMAAATSATARTLHQKQPSGKHVTDLFLDDINDDDNNDDDDDNNGNNEIGIGSSNNSRIGVYSNGDNNYSHLNSNENNSGRANHEKSSNNTANTVDDDTISKNIHNLHHSPSLITYTTTQYQGRRSITLRLREVLDLATTPTQLSTPSSGSSNINTNNTASFVSISSSPLILSSVRSLRRFRSLSLSGLPFVHVANAAVQAQEEEKEKSLGTTTTTTTTSSAAAADAATTASKHDDENGKNPHPLLNPNDDNNIVDRGMITVSWYEGTTSAEMSDHVYNCVLRKLNAERSRRLRQENKMDGEEGAVGGREHKKEDTGKLKLEDVRMIDDTVIPHGEVVLCPFLPDGSSFALQFKTSIDKPPTPAPPTTTPSTALITSSSGSSHRAMPSLPPWYASRAPESPSAEPRSPYPINSNYRSYSDYLLQHQSHSAAQHQQLQTQQLLGAVAALLQKQHQQQQLSGTEGGGLNPNAQSNETGPIRRLPLVVPKIGSVAEEDEEEAAPLTTHSTVASAQEDGDDIEEEGKLDEGDDNDDSHNASTVNPPASLNSPIKMSNNALLAATLGASTTANVAQNSSSSATVATTLTTDQLIEQQLRQLNELFLLRKLASGFGQEGNVGVDVEEDGKSGNVAATILPHGEDDDQAHLVRAYYRAEKKQVIFVIANYFVLFLSLIALSAEIQGRLPQWMDWVQQNYDSVQNCATDQGALIECLSDGDFSGLVASFLLWATQSASAKRIFLFGFDTPKKLWTVVYEALVTAVCWGMSYLFIRRGLNPNTRQHFLQIYWKDAVYGSLAGFNAAFMKAVLKNLIPQEVALEALEGRQLRIRHWLLSLMED